MTGYRAVQGSRLGGPEAFELVRVPRGELREGHVRIQVAAAGVSHVDVLIAGGGYQIKPPTPYVPGLECSGIVREIGAGVEGLQVGDRVAAPTGLGGAYAEEALVRATNVIPLPASLAFADAAITYVNYQTAYHALSQRGGLREGETVLVLGAAGGVGAATIDVARALGARVIACASTAAKRNYALTLGAHDAIDSPGATDWRETVKQATAGRGVDLVIDPVGGDATEPAFRALGWGGRLMVVGFAGGGIARLPANLPLLKGGAMIGVDLRQFREREPALAAENLARINRMIDAGRLAPRADVHYPLDRFSEAMAAATSRERIGRIAILIDAL